MIVNVLGSWPSEAKRVCDLLNLVTVPTVSFNLVAQSESVENFEPFLAPSMPTPLGFERFVGGIKVLSDPRRLVSTPSESQFDKWPVDVQATSELTQEGLSSKSGPGVYGVYNRWKDLARILPSAVVMRFEEIAVDCESWVRGLIPLSLLVPGWEELLPEFTAEESTWLEWLEFSDAMPASVLARFAGQLEICPRIEKIAQQMGYPRFDPPGSDSVGSSEGEGTIVAFHTPDPFYSAEANRLRKSAEKLKLGIEIVEVAPLGDWARTTHLKPRVISEFRERLVGPILYVDVDAMILRSPWSLLATLDCDVAACVTSAGSTRTGTVFMADTPGARDFLSRWRHHSDEILHKPSLRVPQTGRGGDGGTFREVLLEAIDRGSGSFSFSSLPFSFAYVHGSESNRSSDIRPVIEHFQASRAVLGRVDLNQLRNQRIRLRQLVGSDRLVAIGSQLIQLIAWMKKMLRKYWTFFGLR